MDRYDGWGDFQITIKSTFQNRSLLRLGTWIGMQGSDRLMQIESITDAMGDDGSKNLSVTGRSAEKLLDDRVAMPSLGDLTTTPKWVITGKPGDIARYIFSQICVTCVLSPNDTIPGYHSGTILPPGTIPEPSEVVIIEFDPGSVYYDIQKLCQIYAMGFRLIKDGDTGNLYFDVYTGNDRTSAQVERPAIIFSQDLESIDKTSTLQSIASVKTVAYVFTKNGAIMVYPLGYDSSVSGADRRVLLVKDDSMDIPAGPDLDLAMTQKGNEELSKFRKIYAFDGEIPKYEPYIYGVDYGLGDLVEERSPDGFANYMLVTEQIFISDAEGERSYPTLVLIQTITPGAWLSVPADQHWDDVPSDQHWADA